MHIKFHALVALLLSQFISGSNFSASAESKSLVDAATRGNLQRVSQLISQGADIHSADFSGRTALSYASQNGHSEVAQFLIENGADVHLGGNNGDTPLIHAAQNGHYEIAQLLLGNGADVNHVDRFGFTALEISALRRDYKLAELLIKHGSNVNYVDNLGQTPLGMAAQNGHVEIAQLLIENGASVHNVDNALLVAVRFGRAATAQFLVYKGANVNHVDNHGQSALIHAAWSGHDTIAQMLIENGADVNISDRKRMIALQAALVHQDNLVMTRLLVLAGSDVPALLSGYWQRILNDRVLWPLIAIRNSVLRNEPYNAVLPALRESGISPLQGFIFFSFKALMYHVDVSRDSVVIFQDHEWDHKKMKMVESIIQRLLELQCTDLNMLYVVAPFITTADDRTLGRLSVSLDLLTNDIPGFDRPNVASNGRILNAMMQRSAHLGFLPVLRAVYTFYRRTLEVQRVVKHSRVPSELLTSMDASFLNFEHEAMVELSLAIRRHRAALARIHLGQETTFISTTTEIFPVENGEVTTLSTE